MPRSSRLGAQPSIATSSNPSGIRSIDCARNVPRWRSRSRCGWHRGERSEQTELLSLANLAPSRMAGADFFERFSSVALDHSCQVQRTPIAERDPYELYETPPEATKALLRAEKIPPHVLDAGAGKLGITNVLRAAGHTVTTIDIAQYDGFRLDQVCDFLAMTTAPPGVTATVMNPPFGAAERFISHALELTPLVYALLRLAFFEGGTGPQAKHKLRARILDEIPPARLHVF